MKFGDVACGVLPVIYFPLSVSLPGFWAVISEKFLVENLRLSVVVQKAAGKRTSKQIIKD